MNAVQDETVHGTSTADDVEISSRISDTSVAYRLARHEVDDEINEVAVLGYN